MKQHRFNALEVCEQIYLVQNDLKQSHGWFERSELTPQETEWSIARGLYKGGSPIRLKLIRRKKLLPVAWASGYYPVVTEAIIETLTTHRVTGWNYYPVIVENAAAEMDSRFALGIAGRCNRIKYETEPSKFEIRTEFGRPGLFARLVVDFTDWDGSDLFMGRGEESLHRCATKHVVEAVGGVKDLGLGFQRVSDEWLWKGRAPCSDG